MSEEKKTAITVKDINEDLWIRALSKGKLLRLHARDIINQALALWLEQKGDGE